MDGEFDMTEDVTSTRSFKGVRPMTLPDEISLAPSAVSGAGGSSSNRSR